MLTNRSCRASQLRLGILCLAVLAVVGAAPAQAAGKGGGGKKGGNGKNRAGVAYTQTNDPAGNRIVVYKRAANGKLSEKTRVATGGVGSASNPPFGFSVIDSQGSVELTRNGRLLFAVNAGDDTVSSFRVKGHGLRLVDRKSSGGDLPVSLDSQRRLLYVVNSLSGDISGLRFNRKGRMTPIPGSTQSLAPAGGNSAPAQIGFAANRRVLTVTLRGPNVLDTFKLGDDNTPGPARANNSAGPSPFSFEYLDAGHLLTTNAGDTGNPPNPLDLTLFHGSASSYRLKNGGTLAPIDTAETGQRATCWVVITKNDRYAFMANTLSNSVTRFRISHDGNLTRLGNTATGAGFASDEALSRDSRWLYVLLPSEFGGASHIDVYRVSNAGGLTHIQATPSDLPPGVSGMVAR